MNNCKHEKTIPKFDYEDVKNNSLTYVEVRKKYPRFFGICPDCGASVISYHGFEHFICGDW